MSHRRRDPTHVVTPHTLPFGIINKKNKKHFLVENVSYFVDGNVSRTFYGTNFLGNDKHSSSVWKTPGGKKQCIARKFCGTCLQTF